MGLPCWQSKNPPNSSMVDKFRLGHQDLNSGFEEVNTGSIGVSNGSGPVNTSSKKVSIPSPDNAQHYTEEDWDVIRAKLEANAELTKSMLGSDLPEEEFAKKMVDLVNQRKKFFAEERAKARRNAKRQKIDDIDAQLTKEKVDEAKEEEPTKKIRIRRKQIARKGLHTEKTTKDETKKDEVSEKDDPASGTNVPINPVPVAVKPPSIANYKIIKQGKKGVYQIVKENGTDKVYINFGAMLKDISRDDLTELYIIVMQRYGMNGPKDECEKVFWGYSKIMFNEPLSTVTIWSLPGQQRIISWRYYDTCRVHCLNLDSAETYMLTERSYPLSAEVCKVMLDKKLQGGKENEDCYQLLKRMEKQAGIKKD
ncbi:hypothetical protein Tco_0481008 [Tanacetum coccineum]